MTARIKLVRLLPDSDQDIAELQRQRIVSLTSEHSTSDAVLTPLFSFVVGV